VGEMAPPREHIRLIKDGVGEAVLRLIECSGAHNEIRVLPESRSESLMHPVWIDRGDARVFLFVAKFTPDRNANRGRNRRHK
jgi:hypothetical protein